jgi:hypothetical protein
VLGDIELKSPGEYALEELFEQIKGFQDQLGPDMEIGINAAGGTRTIHVHDVQTDGILVVFSGVDNEDRQTRLIQHHTQINVQVVAVKKRDAHARRIGFDMPPKKLGHS